MQSLETLIFNPDSQSEVTETGHITPLGVQLGISREEMPNKIVCGGLTFSDDDKGRRTGDDWDH